MKHLGVRIIRFERYQLFPGKRKVGWKWMNSPMKLYRGRITAAHCRSFRTATRGRHQILRCLGEHKYITRNMWMILQEIPPKWIPMSKKMVCLFAGHAFLKPEWLRAHFQVNCVRNFNCWRDWDILFGLFVMLGWFANLVNGQTSIRTWGSTERWVPLVF